PPFPQRPERRRQLLEVDALRGRSARPPHAELGEKAARLARPRHEQVPLRPRDADVQEPPLLVDVRAPVRQLALLEPWQKHRLELETLRTVQRQQVDAPAGGRAE